MGTKANHFQIRWGFARLSMHHLPLQLLIKPTLNWERFPIKFVCFWLNLYMHARIIPVRKELSL